MASSRHRAPVRLALIGTGGMAHSHARHFAKIPGCQVVAACDIHQERLEAFCREFGITSAFTRTEDLLAGPEIDAVSVVTTDASHRPVTLACLQAGKHVLCEKPLALDYAEASEMVAAAKKAGVVNLVNFSYRNWACIQGAAEAMARGDIGELRHVEASYLQAWLPSKIWGDWRTNPAFLWRLSTRHGSKGVLGDVGVHILDFATYAAGPIQRVYCETKVFPKAPDDRMGEYVLDANDSAAMTVQFANGAMGSIQTSRWVGGHTNRLFLLLAGTLGSLKIDSELSTGGYRICRGEDLDKNRWRHVRCRKQPDNFHRFISAIQRGRRAEPDFERGAKIQLLLDACFQSAAEARAVMVPG